MKIKDVLGEDGVTVAAVSGDKAKLSTGQEIDAKSLTPDAQHPGQYTMPTMDPNAIKPGAVVNTDTSSTTSEDAGSTPYFVTVQNGKPMIKSGNGLTPVQASKLWTEITPEVEEKANSQGFRRIEISANGQTIHGLEGGGKVIVSPADYQALSSTKEGHHDTIHSGNHDIGGDATDNFIDQVRDKDFERAQRPLGESEELTAMLRIAGLR